VGKSNKPVAKVKNTAYRCFFYVAIKAERKPLTAEKLFATLNDGKWHKISELSKQTKVKTNRLTEFFQFLSIQGVITYDKKPTESELNLNGKTCSQTNPNSHLLQKNPPNLMLLG
jgi:hypothetical protein